MKKALITGITGQDGSYLAEFLLDKGYEVHGIIRRSSSFNTGRIDHLYKDPYLKDVRFFLHHGDLSDASSIRRVIYKLEPDEIYNLGAQSHVRVSFDQPEHTIDVTGLGALRILEIIRDFQSDVGKNIKFYQASSSEMFGSAPSPQSERTAFHPRSPYGCAKVLAYNVTVNYREAYNMFAVNGILFNHESPRRGGTFVTRKITMAIAKIKMGLEKELFLGNLDAKRDWGYAPEYMEAAWMMLQKDKSGDYVIGTGETHSIREFLELAFKYAGLGEWSKYVKIDKKYYRPSEVEVLRADISKAKNELKWEPKVRFSDLVKIMVKEDIRLLELNNK